MRNLNPLHFLYFIVDAQEYCRWENFNVTCGPERVILMTSARYGRMKRGRCLTEDVSIGCYGDVLHHADTRCSGRHDCVIRVPDETLHEVQPCSKDYMAYLEASYTCLPGESVFITFELFLCPLFCVIFLSCFQPVPAIIFSALLHSTCLCLCYYLYY